MNNNKKITAVFTIVKDEQLFLPIWVNYYRKHFKDEDIYILNHETNDGGVEKIAELYPSINIIPVFNELAFDHRWVTDTVQNFQKELLEKYEAVLLAEVDEIIYHKRGLEEYIKEEFLPSCENTVRTCGYEIVHQTLFESPLNLDEPIMMQRDYVFRSPQHQDKPYLTRVPLTYHYGYHNCNEHSVRDDNLILIHLNRMDYTMSYNRNLERQAMKLHQGDKSAGYGYQKHLVGQDFSNWFYHQTWGHPIIKMPEDFKHIV